MACYSSKITKYEKFCYFVWSYDIYLQKKLLPAVLHHFHVFDLHTAHSYYKRLCFSDFSPFSKKIGFLAARLVARNFTRALGYAKRPLSPLPDIACCRHRVLPLARTPDIAYAQHRIRPTSCTPDIAYAQHRVWLTSQLQNLRFVRLTCYVSQCLFSSYMISPKRGYLLFPASMG